MASNSMALALPRSLKVNACGRLLEVSTEGSASMLLLRKELVQKLRVCNPASLQLTDVTGKVITTDQHLGQAVQENKLPLQAKLTVAALHEIEQKKKESKQKEHDMVGLQWQIVIEQVAAFSNELAGMGSHLQCVHDDSRKIVQQFEEAERVRREQLMQLIKDEATERDSSIRELHLKVEELAQLILDERTTREVSDYQLTKQIEQVASELNREENARSQDNAALERNISSVRHDLEMEMQKNGASWSRNLDALKNLDQQDKEHVSTAQNQGHRIQKVEADSERLRSSVNQIEVSLTKTMKETEMMLQRFSEEVSRNQREGTASRDHELTCVTKDHETAWQALEQQLQNAKTEATKMCADLSERSRLLEMRCAAVEQENAERWEHQGCKDNSTLDKLYKVTTASDASKVERFASDAMIRNTAAKVEELMERMNKAESTMTTKVPTQHWEVQMENFASILQKQDHKTNQMERTFVNRIAQEHTVLNDHIETLQSTVATCFDRMSQHKALEGPSSTEEPTAFSTRGTTRSVSPQAPMRARMNTTPAMIMQNGQPNGSSFVSQSATNGVAVSMNGQPLASQASPNTSLVVPTTLTAPGSASGLPVGAVAMPLASGWQTGARAVSPSLARGRVISSASSGGLLTVPKR
eukprot:TRINITY_DN3638_c0_g2_i1.p1 TRINITY_DN3638_c0_g2~~TRINITY_DN3638_c0_g2_i1.p1  ORF type:complete len:644 (+),score=216.52 TRINITY_DN3638_c0_g2_i1:94-2025(+)